MKKVLPFEFLADVVVLVFGVSVVHLNIAEKNNHPCFDMTEVER